MAMSPWAVTSPYMNPEQAALTSTAPQRMPEFVLRRPPTEPHCLSGVVVASTQGIDP